MIARVTQLTRRAVLQAGGLAAGAYTLANLLQPAVSGAEPAAASTAAPTYVTGSFVSAARGGVVTNWAIARPPGQNQPLRPVIALHGHDADAKFVMDLGVPDVLARVVNGGRPPFAVVSVDGGNGYWHHRASGDDSGAMVLDELLPMLSSHGLDTSKVAFMGWSMGGYGALLLGARLGPARTAGICAVSPALWTSYLATDDGAFDNSYDWANNTVFGRPEFASIPIRVDCGTGDRFYAATKQFVAQLGKPVAGGFSPGGHDVAYWRGQLPDELSWLAS
ncbi:MAG TPA: alpha/beta hydrolase-fold protein [Mycobacterium sp.]|nr:alpha/beta hydrolase-fold protein [Mycobacterium sp.]